MARAGEARRERAHLGRLDAVVLAVEHLPAVGEAHVQTGRPFSWLGDFELGN